MTDVQPFIVLVVEDETIIRMNALDLIESAGLPAIGAEDADRALDHLESHPSIRLVFTDIQMPGSMDGLTLARHARERWPHLEFIIVSGAVTPDDAELPERARFLSKPYRPAGIVEAVETLLQ